VSGHFPPKTRLIEAQLTKRYDASRASIRSAIVELAKEGLLIREANRGATVRALDRAETIEIYETRAMFEVLMAWRAAELATSEERENLRSLLDRLIEAAKEASPGNFARLGRSLNILIGEIGRHRVAHDLIRVLRNQSRQIPARPSAHADKRDDFLNEFVTVVEAIIRGDAEAAERGVRTHYGSVLSVLVG
jgi:DNA-binding GntR family transcriptional regulator